MNAAHQDFRPHATPAHHAACRQRAARAGTGRDGNVSGIDDVCRLLSLPAVGDLSAEGPVFLRRRIKAGQWLTAAGEAVDAVYAVHAGCLKTAVVDDAGNEQILGFPQKGDLIGMDGIFSGRHASQAVALTDCELVVIPFHELARMGDAAQRLEHLLYRAISRELAREHALVGLLGTLTADARVARFLVSLSDHFHAAGYSATAFRLAMTRKEIGSYLGLTLETASRTLSALDAAGLISIDQREVMIHDLAALRTLQRIPAARAAAPSKKDAAPAKSQASIWAGLQPA